MFEETNVVSTIFTLKADEFNSSLANVNKQMKLTSSEMKLAGSKLRDFGDDTKLLSDKQKILESQVKNVNDKMKIYADSIQKNTERMNNNKAELELLGQKKGDLNKQLKDSIKLFGEESDESKKLKEELDKTNDEYKKKEQQLKNNINAINNHTIELNKNEAQLVELQGELRKTNQEIEKNSNKFLNAGETLNEYGTKISNAGEKLTKVGKTLTVGVTAPIVAVGTMAVKSAIEFESAFAGVKKTVNGTEEQFNELEKGITEMSKKLPTSANDIAHVAEAAGQLGIETDNILGFTKTIIDLGNATNLVGEQGASQLAKFANITQMSQKDFDRLGSTIVALGNNMATTEADIVTMGMRLAGAGKQVGLTEAQIMGLSAALSSVGIEAEAGGSSVSKVMIEMQLAVEKGGDSLEDFAKVAGMSSSQFKKAFKDDAAGALIQFIKGLAESEKKGVSAIKVLDDMGISEVRMRDALLRAAGAGDLFNKSISIGTQAWQENTALVNEANQRYATTESQIAITKNQIVDSARKIGNDLLPAVRGIITNIANLTEKFSTLSPQTQENIIKMALFGAAIGPVTSVVGGLTKGIGGTITTLGNLATKLGTATTATATVGTTASVAGGAGGLGALAGGLGSVLATVAPFALGAGAIATAGYGIYKVMSKEVVPSVDLFADRLEVCGKKVGEFGEVNEYTTVKISEQTKKQVQAYIDMDNGVTSTLEGLYINSTAITDEIKNSTIAKFDEMSNKVVEGYRTQKDSAILETTELFSSTKNITETEQTELLNSISQYYKDQETTVNNAETQIKGILDRASSEHRELTKEEYETVTMWREKMKEKAISALSENEIEAKVILERMKDYDGRITAEQASEHIKKLNESKNKAVATANEEYEKRIGLIERMKAEGIIKSQEQADKMIAEAKRQRDGIIENAEKTRMDAIEKMRQMNTDLETQVDTSTGKILTWWDKLKRWWSGWQPESKSFEYTITARQGQSSPVAGDMERGYYTGTSSVSESGVYKVNELGWELFDSNNNLQSISYNTAYLPSGTSVTNHLASTQQMRRDISSEVSRQIAGNGNKLALLIGEEVGKQLKTNDIATNYNISKLEVSTQIDNNSGVEQLINALNQLPRLATMRR
jgi:TP901 family phage tail tape measure protein